MRLYLNLQKRLEQLTFLKISNVQFEGFRFLNSSLHFTPKAWTSISACLNPCSEKRKTRKDNT